MMKKPRSSSTCRSYAWFTVISCSLLLIVYTQLHTWAVVSINTNCNTPHNDTPYDSREKELQWNKERQRLQTEIRLLKKEIDNAAVLFNKEMKQEATSIVDIFENKSNTSYEQQQTTQQQDVNDILAKDYNITEQLSKLENKNANRRIAFLHLGKTGGSTISIHLRNGCFKKINMHRLCQFRGTKDWITNETIASYRTEEYFHMQYIPQEKQNQYTTILTTVRNPITRFQSAFAFNHPMNKPIKSKQRSFMLSKQSQTYTCFPSLAHLLKAALGHAVIEWNEEHQKDQTPKVLQLSTEKRKNFTKTLNPINCTQAAQIAFGLDSTYTTQQIMENYYKGNHPWFNHMTFDYRQYYKSMPPNKELLVMRTEHLHDDWVKVNDMLSLNRRQWWNSTDLKNETYVKEWPLIPPFKGIKRARDKQEPYRWKTHSKQEREWLCHLLYDEIRIYFMIIMRAVNLDDDDLKEAVYDVQKSCS